MYYIYCTVLCYVLYLLYCTVLCTIFTVLDYRHPHIRPICLPTDTSDDYAGDVATVTGWGRTSYGGSYSNKLLEVDANVITNNQCMNEYRYQSHEITEAMLCAIVPGGSKEPDC